MRYWRYLLLLGLATLLLALAPIPTRHVARVAAKLMLRGGDTVMLGPSTVDQRSRCDADQRTIAEMLAAALGTPVRDVSDGGQTPEESADFATLALRVTAARRVVILIDTAYLSAQTRLKRPDAAFFRIANGGGVPGRYLDLLQAYAGRPEHDPGFVYRGIAVAGYAELLTTWLADEMRRMPCPENDGHDLLRVEAVNFHEQVAPSFDPQRLAAFAHLAAALHGRQALVVLLPVDTALLGQFQPDWPGIVARRVAAARSGLTALGLPVLDLSTTLPKADFVNRWCGCVHLSQEGRLAVATAIAGALRE